MLSKITTVLSYLFSLIFLAGFSIYFKEGTRAFFASLFFLAAAVLVFPLFHTKVLKLTSKLYLRLAVLAAFVLYVVGSIVLPPDEQQRGYAARQQQASLVQQRKDEAKAKKDLEDQQAAEQKRQEEAARVEAENARPAGDRVADTAKQFGEGYTASLTGERAALDVKAESKTFLNETHQLETLLKDFINFGKAVKDIPGVTQIAVNYSGTLIDTYGNEKPGNLMWVEMDVEKFLLYKWENLPASKIYSSAEKDLALWVLPTTRAKINFAKVNVVL